MTSKAPIAIVFQNIIQYFSLRPLIEFNQSAKRYHLDLLIFEPLNDTDGFSNITEELKSCIAADGLKFFSSTHPPRNHYKICLAPYDNMTTATADYLLCYYYGSACPKPNPTFSPELKSAFHGFLIHSTYDASVLSLYGQTHIVPNLRFRPITSTSQHSGRPTLLYLPTYGDVGGSDHIASRLVPLKKDYHIIVKGHHGIEHLKSDQGKKHALADLADEYYGSTANMQELFSRADLVVSDNSGAIFDALYVGVPVCIIAPQINKKLGEMNTLQSMLVQEKIIPYSRGDSPDDIAKTVRQTHQAATIKTQRQYAKTLFPNRRNDGVADWTQIIDAYLADQVDQNYIALHNYVNQYYETLRSEHQALTCQNQELHQLLAEFESSFVHRALRKIRRMIKKA